MKKFRNNVGRIKEERSIFFQKKKKFRRIKITSCIRPRINLEIKSTINFHK